MEKSLTQDELRDIFIKLDKNGDGTVDASEFAQLMSYCGEQMTSFEVKLMFHLCNVSNQPRDDQRRIVKRRSSRIEKYF